MFAELALPLGAFLGQDMTGISFLIFYLAIRGELESFRRSAVCLHLGQNPTSDLTLE